MLKSATALLTALTAGWVFFGSPTSASAGEDCGACRPTTEYRHTHKTEVKEVTHNTYRNVDEKVPVRHTIVTIHHIHHILHVHDVLHVTIHKVPVPYEVYRDRFASSYSETHDFRKIVHYVGCGCRD
jgi:hypothetical protein